MGWCICKNNTVPREGLTLVGYQSGAISRYPCSESSLHEAALVIQPAFGAITTSLMSIEHLSVGSGRNVYLLLLGYGNSFATEGV